jgi:hypothetical protein
LQDDYDVEEERKAKEKELLSIKKHPNAAWPLVGIIS